jgi:hypothetical protein
MQDDPSPVEISWIGIATDPGKIRVLTTVAGLAETLMGSWPEEEMGDVWRGAVAACLRALEAQTNGDAAREAFILAARDGNVTLITDPGRLAPGGGAEKRPRKKPTWRSRGH